METQAFFTEAEAAAFCRAHKLPVKYERIGVVFVVALTTIEGTAVEVIPTVETDEPLNVKTTVENIGVSTFTHSDPDADVKDAKEITATKKK